jgi:nitrous oxidase accessory protein NosD
MLMRTLSIGAVAISVAASVAMAAGLTEQLQTGRMTVLKVDRGTGQFLCVEHGRWTSVVKQDLQGLQQGDIVRVERGTGHLARLVLLRTAADELSVPEQ